jgi:hypothetical protein
MRPRFRLLLSLSPFALLLACSSSPSQPDTSNELASFAQQFCAYVMPCCGQAPDPTTCESVIASDRVLGFDPRLTSACLTAMKQAAATTDFCSSLGAASEPCQAVFASVPSSGTTPPGGSCVHADDCAAPTSAGFASCLAPSPAPDGAARNCYQVINGKAGDGPCYAEEYAGITASEGTASRAYKSYVCHDFDGVFCNFDTHLCQPFLAAGAPCDINGDSCGPYQYCASMTLPDGSFGSVCKPLLQAGASCDPSTVTNEKCDFRTTHCRGDTRTCTPFLPNGSACTMDEQCDGACRAGQCVTALQAKLCNAGATASSGGR